MLRTVLAALLLGGLAAGTGRAAEAALAPPVPDAAALQLQEGGASAPPAAGRDEARVMPRKRLLLAAVSGGEKAERAHVPAAAFPEQASAAGNAAEPGRQSIMEVQVGWLVSSMAAALAVLSALLAWRTRCPSCGWWAAAHAAWAGHTALLALGSSGGGSGLWNEWLPLSATLFLSALTMCGLRLLRTQERAPWRPMLPFLALFLLAAASPWIFDPFWGRILSLLLTAAVVAVAAIVLVRLTLQQHSRLAALLLWCTAGMALASLWGWPMLRGAPDPVISFWSPYAGLLPMLSLAWLAAGAQARLLQQVRRLSDGQQEALDAKVHELQQAFELRRAQERQQAVLDERNRILREMHDGLGGRLVGAIALARQLESRQASHTQELMGELRHALDDCLIELRLALDSLETDQRSLGEALAEMRFRVEPSLRAAGVRLIWDVDDSAMDQELPGADTLHVLRIVREALTNVIKHAGATTVRLMLQREPGGLMLRVLDNGGQQSPPAAGEQGVVSGHRGLANMQQRAQALGARLSAGRHAEGWAVTLHLPLPQDGKLAAAA